MTRERAKELLPIITAWANGEAIEIRTGPDTGWRFCCDFKASDICEYRIKPKAREWWITHNPDAKLGTAQSVAWQFPPNGSAIHVREVLE